MALVSRPPARASRSRACRPRSSPRRGSAAGSGSSSSTSATTSPASSSRGTRPASSSSSSPTRRRPGADVLVTCGGVQSNHCRATAFAAAKRGLGAVRAAARRRTPPRRRRAEANALLDRLAGAEVRFVSHDAVPAARRGDGGGRRRAARARAAAVRDPGGRLERAREPRVRARRGGAARPAPAGVARRAASPIAYAAGSGGTGAGIELGLRLLGWRGATAIGFAVCNDAALLPRAPSPRSARRRGGAGRRCRRCPRRRSRSTTGSSGPGYAQTTERGARDHPARGARGRRPPRSRLHREGDARPRRAARAEPGALPSRRVVLVPHGRRVRDRSRTPAGARRADAALPRAVRPAWVRSAGCAGGAALGEARDRRGGR